MINDMKIEPTQGWGILLKYRNADGGFLRRDIFNTRSEAIKYYNSIYFKPDMYLRQRRKGEVLAVRVKLVFDPVVSSVNIHGYEKG